MTARHVPTGQGATYRLFGGDVITIKVTGVETGGAFCLHETVTPPGQGPPPHIHHREEETFYVLEGEFEFTSQGRSLRPRPGDVLVMPIGIPHAFRNVGPTPGKLLILCRPAGFEHFVADFSQIPPDAPPDFPRMLAIGQKHGIEFVPSA